MTRRIVNKSEVSLNKSEKNKKRLIPSIENGIRKGLSCLFFCLFCSNSSAMFSEFFRHQLFPISFAFHDPLPLHTHEKRREV